MFFNELDLLEIRLNELSEVVDYFVLCESSTTHSGKSKPLYYAESKERFSAFNDRIVHLICDFPEVLPKAADDSWAREYYQRSIMTSALTSIANDDIVMVSDLDEIPNPKVVKDIIANMLYPCVLDFSIHYLYANWRAAGDMQGTVIQAKKNIVDIQHMRELRGSLPRIPNAGWHLSYMGGIDSAFKKLESFAHTEFFTMLHYTKADVQAWFDAQETQFSKKMTVEMPSGPKYLLENRKRFAHLFSPATPDTP